ncbi:interleukin-21-like isoform X2 [Brienomyrus brachyistius]|nr:interleukin-21-like isoform X2 [Brienomyrus brachyistius]XP_048858584.1 interleukin-21-like isoform X2 [Brienomyrus brachyistius]
MENKLMRFKVDEVLKDLNRLKKVQQDTSLMLNIPSDYEENCSLSALDCFGKNLTLLQGSQTLISKISTSLKSKLIVKAVNSRHKKDGKVANCLACGSYPKNDSKKFLEELGSVLQKANSRLMETS